MNYKFVRFDIDHNLMFIIQNYLNESTQEILTTLHEIANSITSDVFKSTRALRLNKRCKLFYKKTNIPILVICSGNSFTSHERHKSGQPYEVWVEIRFPKKIYSLDLANLEALANERFEKSIGLRDEMTVLAPLNKPEVQVPRRLKGVL